MGEAKKAAENNDDNGNADEQMKGDEANESVEKKEDANANVDIEDEDEELLKALQMSMEQGDEDNDVDMDNKDKKEDNFVDELLDGLPGITADDMDEIGNMEDLLAAVND